MNFFPVEISFHTMLALSGLILGGVSLLLVWVYVITAARGVNLPDYKDFRTNINLSYLFCVLVLSFLYLTGEQTVAAECMNLMAAVLGGWIVTVVATVPFLAFCRKSRSNIKLALSASLFKVILTILFLWLIH
jgi:hypothetical protein